MMLASNAVAAAAIAVATNSMPPVVVEASRMDKTALELPFRAEVMTAREISRSGAQSIPELLQNHSGVWVRNLGAGNPALAQISMRGYGENSFGRTMVVVDGERLNNPDMSAPNLSRIPFASIRQLEVMHGPQTVLYGDNASAGVINFTTAPGGYERKTTVGTKVGSWNTVGANAATRGGDAEAGVAYWASGDWLHSEGYRDNSGYDLWNLSGGVRKDWVNGSFARLSFFYSDADYELPGAVTRDQWRFNPEWANKHYDWARFYSYGLNLTGYGVINDEHALKLQTGVSTRRARAFYHFDDWGSYDENYLSDVWSWTVSPQYICRERIAGFGNELTLGADLRYDTFLGHDDFTGTFTSATKMDRRRLSAGVYARDEFFFTDELSLILGTRLERAMARNERALKRSRNDNTPAYEAALKWRPVEGARLYARWCRFFRNPFVDETPWQMIGWVSHPREILAPERGYTVEVGGDWDFLDDFSVGGVLFAGETKNEIFYNAVDFTNMNSPDDVLREGFEAHLSWEREKFAGLTLRYAFTRAQFNEGRFNGADVPLVPRNKASLMSRFWLWDDCFVRGGYVYWSRQVSCSDFNNVMERIPGYGIFTCGAEYSPEAGIFSGLTIAFDVHNLFDKRYCDFSTYGANYYPAAGRCFMLSMKYEF